METVRVLHSRNGVGITRGEVRQFDVARTAELVEMGLVERCEADAQPVAPQPVVSTIKRVRKSRAKKPAAKK